VKYKISDKCIQCFACIRSGICPVQAFREKNNVYYIDTDKCTDCGKCFEKQEYFCPVRAIIVADK
jgi:ferredoxin